MNVVPFRSHVLPPGEAAQKILSVIQKMDAAVAELDQLLGPHDSACPSKTDQRDVDRFGPYADAVYDLRTLQGVLPRLVELARQRVG